MTTLAITVIEMFIIFSGLLGAKANFVNCDEKTECCSPDCLFAAEFINKSLNIHMDPCEDFYEFACGGFLNSTVIPDEESEVDGFSQLKENFLNIIFRIFGDSVEENDSLELKIMKQVFTTCNDEVSIQKESVKELEAALISYGGWPVLSGNWNDTNYSLYDQLVNTSLSGLDLRSLFYDDLQKQNHMYINLYPAYPIVKREYLIRGMGNPKVQAYYKLMIDIITALGGNKTSAEEDMNKVVELEIDMNKAMHYRNHTLPQNVFDGIRDLQIATGKTKITREMMFRRIDVKLRELDDYLPGFQWIKYLNVTYSKFYNITGDEMVAINHPVATLWTLVLMNTMSNRTLGNFILWKYVYKMVPALSENIRKLRYTYEKYIDFTFTEEKRPVECYNLIMKSFTTEFASTMVEKYFTPTYMDKAKDLMLKMKEQFIEIIPNITWMNGTSESKALKKATTMKQTISFPRTFPYAEPTVRAFEQLKVNNMSFVENFRQVMQYAFIRKMANDLVGIDIDDLDYFLSIANSMEFYENGDNTVRVPAGFLQGVLFGKNRTNYLDFGGLGAKYGHTIFHSIDTKGKDYNSEGQWSPWWNHATSQNYQKFADCFIKQYDIWIEEIEMKVNSEFAVVENFADNFAMNVTYGAFLNLIDEKITEKKLPGLKYTPQQMFWLQYARANCRKDTYQSLFWEVALSGDTPRKYRVNIPLGNSDYFKRDWNCTPETKMGSQHICRIW